MYHGHLTTIAASKKQLWRLTEWNVPEHRIDAVYTDAHARVLVPLRWAEWVEAEAKRIGQDASRHAAVVQRKNTLAVYVNLVAGDGHVLEDDDEDVEV